MENAVYWKSLEIYHTSLLGLLEKLGSQNKIVGVK